MIKQVKSKFINNVIPLTVGIFCAVSAMSMQLLKAKQVAHPVMGKDKYIQQHKDELLKLSLLEKLPSFGFDNLISDWAILSFLLYFGDSEARNQTGYSLSADYLELIAENDPLFTKAYTIISPASSMFAGTPQRTVEIMNKGLAKMTAGTPDAYYVWLYKAMDEVLFLGDLKEAKKSYEMSANWAKKSGNKRIAKSAEDTAKFLATKPDIRSTQVNVWFMVWNNSKDQRIRQIAETKIESIGGELKTYSDGRVEAIPPQNSKP